MSDNFLPYDPGDLPTAPSPKLGEKLSLRVEGYPPKKNVHFSIRNSRHKEYSRFVALRRAASLVMAGRAPYRGAVSLDFEMHAPGYEDRWSLNYYVGGIMDTLDGSHGCQFTYLPIVYEDDCQIVLGKSVFREDTNIFYILEIEFLP